jgi:hypothetical protein
LARLQLPAPFTINQWVRLLFNRKLNVQQLSLLIEALVTAWRGSDLPSFLGLSLLKPQTAWCFVECLYTNCSGMGESIFVLCSDLLEHSETRTGYLVTCPFIPGANHIYSKSTFSCISVECFKQACEIFFSNRKQCWTEKYHTCSRAVIDDSTYINRCTIVSGYK